jgi:hypothetical protein
MFFSMKQVFDISIVCEVVNSPSYGGSMLHEWFTNCVLMVDSYKVANHLLWLKTSLQISCPRKCYVILMLTNNAIPKEVETFLVVWKTGSFHIPWSQHFLSQHSLYCLFAIVVAQIPMKIMDMQLVVQKTSCYNQSKNQWCALLDLVITICV